MKAIVYEKYGAPDVLRLADIDTPAPLPDQVLIKIHAASLNPLDWHYMRGIPYLVRMGVGSLRPKIGRLGVDFSGTVESVGQNVNQFRPGDAVFGGKLGAFAEYVCLSETRALVLKPSELTFEQAASVPIAALTALQALRDRGKTEAGQKVLINGASGGVGTFAIQIARSLGAEVTGVCSSKNIELVKSIGANHVVDYTERDFTTDGNCYDVILDNVSNHALSAYRRILNPHGKYVLIGGGRPNDGRWLGPLVAPARAAVLSRLVTQQMGAMLADLNPADLATLCGLMVTGQVSPVIDRHYTLGEVPEAIQYLEEGHARGKVIIAVASP
ncbi:MAG: NAD(P)-dependent alcohol dehydrogenase [bacterium]|nr:NAD(P)-dependent alcohol dehydrogenase [bacterium]